MKWIFILPIVIVMFVSLEMGRQLYMTDSTRDIYEVTNNVSDKVYGNYYNNTVTLGNESSLNQCGIIKSIGKGMDFVMYGAISFMLYNVEYGFNHPNINYGLFIWICIVILWILTNEQ